MPRVAVHAPYASALVDTDWDNSPIVSLSPQASVHRDFIVEQFPPATHVFHTFAPLKFQARASGVSTGARSIEKSKTKPKEQVNRRLKPVGKD